MSHHNPFEPDENDIWAGIEVPSQGPTRIQTIFRFGRELFVTVIQAVILALLIIYFVAQATVVHGRSMEPSLHTNQRLIIDKVSYRFFRPQRGDIVVIDVADSELPLIKRVVGLPGETVEIRDSQVLIDGRVLVEPYLPVMNQADYGPVQVPPETLFVMGDNRLDSRDSRVFGPVAIEQVLGRAWVSYWPLGEIGLVR